MNLEEEIRRVSFHYLCITEFLIYLFFQSIRYSDLTLSNSSSSSSFLLHSLSLFRLAPRAPDRKVGTLSDPYAIISRLITLYLIQFDFNRLIVDSQRRELYVIEDRVHRIVVADPNLVIFNQVLESAIGFVFVYRQLF